MKTCLSPHTANYRGLRHIYRRVIFPFERLRYLRSKNAGGYFNAEEELHMCALLPRATLDSVVQTLHPQTWLDVGCGMGVSLKYILRQGIDANGIELSDQAIALSGLADKITRHDLSQPLDLHRLFDVVWCYEVAEHLPPEAADCLVTTLAMHTHTVILSAARPGQGGAGHLNEQEPDYWIQKFNAKGWKLDETLTAKIHLLKELYSDNVMVFQQGEQ